MSQSSNKGRKRQTPKQVILTRWPNAFADWVPGWGIWNVFGCAAGTSTGFIPRDAWRNAARTSSAKGRTLNPHV